LAGGDRATRQRKRSRFVYKKSGLTLAKGQVKNLKQELLSQLENAKNNYVLGLAALSLFASAETYPILEKSHCSFGPYSISFDQVTNLLRIQNDRDIAAKEFIKMLLRALIK
jgi:hypothetical protein